MRYEFATATRIIFVPGTIQEVAPRAAERCPRSPQLTHSAAPYIAIPATADTGAEVTRNAVLGSPEHHVKVSMRSPLMLPRLAVVDPELTHSMQSGVTGSTGLDAVTQLRRPMYKLCSLVHPIGLPVQGATVYIGILFYMQLKEQHPNLADMSAGFRCSTTCWKVFLYKAEMQWYQTIKTKLLFPLHRLSHAK